MTVSTSALRPGARELRFVRSVDRRLPHRRALSEVFLTDTEAAGDNRFLAGALPLRSALDDLRHTLLVPDPDAGALRSLVRWCEAELAEVVDVRVVPGLGRRVAVLARPDGHVDWTVKDDAAAMRARLTDLFRPLLRTRQQASGEQPRRHGDDGARHAPSTQTDEARQEVQA